MLFTNSEIIQLGEGKKINCCGNTSVWRQVFLVVIMIIFCFVSHFALSRQISKLKYRLQPLFAIFPNFQVVVAPSARYIKIIIKSGFLIFKHFWAPNSMYIVLLLRYIIKRKFPKTIILTLYFGNINFRIKVD